MPTYSSKNHLLTPRKGRKKFRSPVHKPSRVLLWTSRMPSPSSSRAHSRCPGVWHTVACARPVRATQAYPLHSSVYSTTSGRVAWPTNHCKVAASTVSATHNWISPVSRPTTPSTGGRSVSQVPWPRALLARRRGGSSGWPCFLPFFPRILEHLVGLGFGVGQRSPGQGAPGQVLQAVAQLQQVPAAAPQLSGQLGGRRPLGDAADDQNQLAGAALRALQGRAGPGVEDAPAGAPVVQDGVAMSPM